VKKTKFCLLPENSLEKGNISLSEDNHFPLSWRILPQTRTSSPNAEGRPSQRVLTEPCNLLSAGNLFFPRYFSDSAFAGKHSIPDTKHYCKNSSLFIYVMIFGRMLTSLNLTQIYLIFEKHHH
jgi:hypothetical protein